MPRDDSSEAVALSFDPFAGDFGGSGQHDRVLSDRIVTTHGGHACHNCLSRIQALAHSRVRVEVYDDSLMVFRWCGPCTTAMAKDSNEYEDRMVLR